MTDRRKNVLIVDDERDITDLLELYMQNEGYNVYKFYRAEGALDCIRNNDIDLALLDVMLPDMDGLTLCRFIRKQWFFPIIMITAKVEETDMINGMTLGADDYITKPFNPLEVVARVKAQLRRADSYNRSLGRGAEREYYNIRGLEINAADHSCQLYEESISVTPIEFSILLCLCRRLGEVVTAEEIFEDVWGEKCFDNNNTVFAHIARIREKLHENSRKPKFIKTVWGVGYKIER